MKTVLDELITKFRFDVDRTGLKTVERGMESIHASILKISATAAAVFGGGALLGVTAERLDNLQKFADTIGISVVQLQQLQFAAERAGVSTGDLRSSLLNINRVIGESARGYGVYAEVLARYGVSIRNARGNLLSSFDIFRELNQVFSKLGTAQQFDLAQNLGLTPNTIKLLQQTPKEFNETMKAATRYGVATRTATERAAKFEDSLANLKQEFFGLTSQTSAVMLPAFTKLIDIFSGFISILEKNAPLIKAITTAVAILSAAFAVLKLRAIVAWAAVFGPITAASAALAGIVLILQDIEQGLKGNHSVILGLFNATMKWIGSLHSVKIIIKSIYNAWVAVMHFVDYSINKIDTLINKMHSFLSLTHLRRSLSSISAPQINAMIRSNITPASTPSIVQSQMVPQIKAAMSPPANKTVNVNVNGININAPNSDSQDISEKISGMLRVELKKSVIDFDSDRAI